MFRQVGGMKETTLVVYSEEAAIIVVRAPSYGDKFCDTTNILVGPGLKIPRGGGRKTDNNFSLRSA